MAGRPYQATSQGIVIGLLELEKLKRTFSAAQHALTTHLADAIGEQQVGAARRRILNTNRDPSGKRWAKWSPRYAKTRTAENRILKDTEDLSESMTHNVLSPLEVEVGSNLVYAGAHLYGRPDVKLPARPYLDTDGSFADSVDREEIRDLLRDLWEREVLK
jgi:phage virion morphogenesis protein